VPACVLQVPKRGWYSVGTVGNPQHLLLQATSLPCPTSLRLFASAAHLCRPQVTSVMYVPMVPVYQRAAFEAEMGAAVRGFVNNSSHQSMFPIVLASSGNQSRPLSRESWNLIDITGRCCYKGNRCTLGGRAAVPASRFAL
jgi:hypothetical protein